MDQLAIGIILSSYGLKGELKVKSLSGEIEHFFKLEEIYIGQENKKNKFIIEQARKINNSLLLKLRGIDNPEDARCLNGLEVFVSRDKASPIHENEFYYKDLVGCSIIRNSVSIGHVVSIIDTANGCLLEIDLVQGGRIMIPFLKQFVGKVEIESHKIFLTKEAEIF
jgi:16S rRNA processing protein RimM